MKIAFIYQHPSTFVIKDLAILKAAHDVRTVQYRGTSDIPQLWQAVRWCDATFSWFGSLHAFIAVLLSRAHGKRSVVVAGGWDAGQSPDGLMFQPSKRWCPYYAFTNADLVLAVSDYNMLEATVNLDGRLKRIQRIYHGFDSGLLKRRSNTAKKRNMVATVSSVAKFQIRRKGLDLFANAASLLPDSQFVMAGEWLDQSVEQLRRLAPSTMVFAGRLSEEDLALLYDETEVYVQASVHEAFGCSLAEAMLHECVPVVSRLSALPEVVGNCGIYLDELTASELAVGIREALSRPELGKMARERIMNLFPLQKRAEGLLRAVDELGAS